MRIEFTGRKIQVEEPLRRLGERKLGRLLRILPGITRAHVVLSTDRHRQVAEVNVRSPHLDLLAREAGPDFGASLSAAFEKLERQARDRVGKRIDRRRRAGAPRRGEASRAAERPRPAPAGEDGRPRAASWGLRTRRVVPPVLTLDEAATELARRPEGFVLFRDETALRLRVLFRGPDGRLGLLEPEV
jgi:putative sigma-54 modulation protein